MNLKAFHLRFVLAFLLVLLMGSILPSTAAAAGQPKNVYPVEITLAKMENVDMSQPFTVSGSASIGGFEPLTNKDVLLEINGNLLGHVRTDSNGAFNKTFKGLNDAGFYTISASMPAEHLLIGGAASTGLLVLPADVRVQTVPPIAGVSFLINQQQIITGQDGVADIKLAHAGSYSLTIQVDQYSNPDLQIQFARWLDEPFTPSTNVQVPTNNVVTVGLNVFEKVSESYVDLQKVQVDPQRVTQVTIRSAQGDQFTFTDNQPHWIPASRITRRSAGLEATPLLYSVISAMVDGTNAVNQSQQRFFVHPNDTWEISLILYTLGVHAQDGLFGSSVGRSVTLVYPDGHQTSYPLTMNGTLSIGSLARGHYTVQVKDAKGLKQVIPVALSRSQTVEVKIVTNMDLFVIFLLGLLAVINLILYGRRRWLGDLISRRRSASQNGQIAAVQMGSPSNEESTDGPSGPGMLRNP